MLECLAPTTEHRHTIMAEVTVGCPYFSEWENTVHTERIRAKGLSKSGHRLLLDCSAYAYLGHNFAKLRWGMALKFQRCQIS